MNGSDCILDESQGRFATEQELRKALKTVDYTKGEATHAGINVFTDGKTSQVFESDDFTMVIGATGSRKTQTVVTPAIYSHALAGHSMIITDVKRDILKFLNKTLRGLGYKILVFDLDDPDRGCTYNPFDSISQKYKSGKKGQAMNDISGIAESIFGSVHSDKDPFWENIGKEYFKGMVGTLCEYFPQGKVNMGNVLALRTQGEDTFGASSTYLKAFFESKENSTLWPLMKDAQDTAKETKASINSVFATALNRFAQNESVLRQLAKSSFNMRTLQNEKTALFILCNEQSLATYDVLISFLISHWYYELMKISEENGGRLKREVLFALDEFGNLPAIQNFDRVMSLSRARGINIMVVLQSKAQLTYRYGQEVANIILSNTSNFIYLFSPDMELLKYISEMCGTVQDKETHQQRPLVSVNQLRHFDKEDGEALMILGRLHPTVTYLVNITDYYGIDSVQNITIQERKHEELEPIDFKAIVHDEVKKKFKGRKDNKDSYARPVVTRKTSKEKIINLNTFISRINSKKKRRGIYDGRTINNT